MKLDLKFKDEVAKIHDGESIKLCYQCGTCTGSCPIAFVTGYNPRKYIQLALLGLKGELLSNKDIWLCSGCYTCYERCPQSVKPAYVIRALCSLAAKTGNIPVATKTGAQTIIKQGRINPVTDFIQKQREKFGLPKLGPINSEELQKIAKKTGFDKLIELR